MLSRTIKLTQTRAFQTTAKKNLTIPFLSTLPQAPGGVTGQVNEAYVAPPPEKLHGSLHWNFERALAISLVPLVTVPLATTGSISTALDATLASVLLAHCYVGLQSCIIDYIPARVYGKNHNYAMYLLGIGSVFSAVGIYQIETKEGGIMGVVKNLWTKPAEEKK
ncbi:Succinate dehydrogenase [ubiquinone] cytochrome b small subunit [Kluyveromyces marxianus]|uniref:Succinate dehydrogenase [ubiquinone] cytochrome b small subunit n=1 Tax=Kluyveromyces marxianus TaxID=4911 RepID=A0ABX6EYJ7_KLUMA|nr:membrane anchor subunit of succinate dehydrogenase, Sdh4 [Kluyveromyces marxianus]KAG0685390.1 membrane anchor subunit of succinate dehydrogenase, Sdh4 [Kluyveromyces marxianus]QGN16911.1 succinate dehydrogenase [Kluyveromyces marxianus]BAP72654.1 succinate dehydrogenase [ubiquinone] cytochrome b small subunit [Kluyveromyces marxianus]